MKFRSHTRWLTWGISLFLGIDLSIHAQTNAVEVGFQAANAQVAAGKFAEGKAQYSQLPTGEKTSVALEYNRGVAHSRLGEVGQARAHWLLAERLAPRNPAVQNALHRSSGPGTTPAAEPFDSPLSWTDALTLNEWGALALILTWFWGAMLLLGRGKPSFAAALRGYTLGAGLLAVVSVGLLAGAWARRARLPDAIVLRPETLVRVSPLDEARGAFSLAEGVRVRSQAARAGWFLVEDPLTRRFGWVKSEALLRLPLQ